MRCSDKAPENVTLALVVLVMILWREGISSVRRDVFPASLAAIDARVWRRSSGRVDGVEGLVVALAKELVVLVVGHGDSFKRSTEFNRQFYLTLEEASRARGSVLFTLGPWLAA